MRYRKGPVPGDLGLTGATVGGVARPPPHVRKHSHSPPPDGDIFPPLILQISQLNVSLLVEAEVPVSLPVVPLQPLLLGEVEGGVGGAVNLQLVFQQYYLVCLSKYKMNKH